MAMVVQHNLSAQLALGELNKNNNRLSKALAKVSSGQKINSAQDDASSYVISEKMREQIRTLTQDNQNVQNGSSLFKIADGAINSIVDELRNLKELAINAANDTNTDMDRATIQKEFSQRMANINDIATVTTYNGMALLDGTWGRKVRPTAEDAEDDVEIPQFTSIKPDVSEPTGTATTINGDYNITAAGVYQLTTGAGNITIADGVTDVKFTQASGTGTLDGVSITGPADGNANIWIDGLNISNGTSIFKFQGSDNVLTVKGNNVLKETSSTKAAINVGGGLVVQGNGTHSLQITMPNGSTGAAIGSDGGSTSSGGDVGVYNVTMKDSYAHYGSVIGSGGYGASIGKVIVEDSDITAKGYYNAIIGSGHSNSSADDIWIVSSKVQIGKVDGEQGLIDTGIGSGFSDSTCGNITILDSEIEIHNSLSACIGAGDAAECGDIFISASKIKGQSDKGACVGSGQNGSKAGDVTIANGTSISHKSPDGAAIGTGKSGIVGKITITQSSLNLLDSSQAYSDENQPYPGVGRGRGGSVDDLEVGILGAKPKPGKPLIIHHGTKANQATKFYIEDMHTNSLKGTIPNESDDERLNSMADIEDEIAYKRVLNSAQNMTLDNASVTTKKNANIAIRVIDGALEYALDQATQIGSYLQRLEYTDTNITTMGENVQSAESVIRDSDMAKEMTEFTKQNVLTQSAQAMLAQANQNGSAVLSLLQ